MGKNAREKEAREEDAEIELPYSRRTSHLESLLVVEAAPEGQRSEREANSETQPSVTTLEVDVVRRVAR